MPRHRATSPSALAFFSRSTTSQWYRLLRGKSPYMTRFLVLTLLAGSAHALSLRRSATSSPLSSDAVSTRRRVLADGGGAAAAAAATLCGAASPARASGRSRSVGYTDVRPEREWMQTLTPQQCVAASSRAIPLVDLWSTVFLPPIPEPSHDLTIGETATMTRYGIGQRFPDATPSTRPSFCCSRSEHRLSPPAPPDARAAVVVGPPSGRVARYFILRSGGTERQNSSPLVGEKRAGAFRCAGCRTKLFDAADKFESGTGWPSFGFADEATVEVEAVNPAAALLLGAEVRVAAPRHSLVSRESTMGATVIKQGMRASSRHHHHSERGGRAARATRGSRARRRGALRHVRRPPRRPVPRREALPGALFATIRRRELVRSLARSGARP